MAITVNVTGVGGSGGASGGNNSGASGGGYNNGGGGYNSGNGYQRPDYSQYAPTAQNNVAIPSSDRMINDIRSEISRRGVLLVPGTSNFSTILNTLQQNQKNSITGAINNQYESRIQDIDKRDAALYNDIRARLDASRENDLRGVTNPQRIRLINAQYDELEEREARRAGQFFAGEYGAAARDRDVQLAESERNLTDAMRRLTEELTAGNKDSYLNKLRDKYREAVWRRDNAETAGEVREASKEAAKIQERISRAMNGGSSLSPTAMRMIGLTGTLAGIAGNYLVRSTMLEDQERWGLTMSQAGSVLNGNAYNAIRQRNAIEEQKSNLAWGSGASASLAVVGGVLGSVLPGIGTAVGTAIGAAVGGIAGMAGSYFFGGGREREKENKRADAADLWRQAEDKIMQYNSIALLHRSLGKGTIEGLRSNLIGFAGVDSPSPYSMSDSHLDLYDLGYTAPEFSQQVVNRVRQRGFSLGDADFNYSLKQDAIERYFNMSSGSLGGISKYDRYAGNYSTQDFANLAMSLSALGTLGMSKRGGFVRGDEFAGYMSQLQGYQNSTFLNVNNSRIARQILTGQSLFGNRFGSEVMQGIQAINSQVQNPKGGIEQTLLYEVIQELFPETRGRIDLIESYQYNNGKDPRTGKNIQDEIQQRLARRIQDLYGGVDTAQGYLAFKSIYGINNPNVLKPLARKMVGGGLEGKGLETADVNDIANVFASENYTPRATQGLRHAQDNQMMQLLGYQQEFVKIAAKLLQTVQNDISTKINEVINELRQ